MKITMDMSDYRLEAEDPQTGYDDEVLSAGWNPAVDQVNLQLQLVSTEDRRAKFPGIPFPEPLGDLDEEVSSLLQEISCWH